MLEKEVKVRVEMRAEAFVGWLRASHTRTQWMLEEVMLEPAPAWDDRKALERQLWEMQERQTGQRSCTRQQGCRKINLLMNRNAIKHIYAGEHSRVLPMSSHSEVSLRLCLVDKDTELAPGAGEQRAWDWTRTAGAKVWPYTFSVVCRNAGQGVAGATALLRDSHWMTTLACASPPVHPSGSARFFI